MSSEEQQQQQQQDGTIAFGSVVGATSVGVVEENFAKDIELEHAGLVVASPINTTTTTTITDAEAKPTKERKQPQTKRQLPERQRRRHKYQTKDLIREISPQPDTQAATFATATTQGDENSNRENNSIVEATSNSCGVENNTEGQSDTKQQIIKELSSNGKRTVQCNICKRCMTESKLANHIRLLHFEGGKAANSDQADNNNTSNTSSSTAADAKRKEFRCEYCGKSYAIKYTFDQHVKTHIEGRPKCPECGSTFASAFSLFRHRAKSHNLEHNYTTHRCDQCDKTFFSVSELTLHQQRHSSKKEYECPECKKAFSVKGNLRIHMRTHAKEKLYKCDICENSFSHPYSLVSHRRIHTNEFPYQCTECKKTYRSKHQLTSHMNVHSDNRPFKCDECSKTFRSRTAFKMHQDQHKGIKRFTCRFCDRKFQCHANKLKHERRHIGVKRHKCERCDKAFIEKQELKNHQKVHDREGAASDTAKSANKTTKTQAKRSAEDMTAAEEPAKVSRKVRKIDKADNDKAKQEAVVSTEITKDD